VFTNTILSYIVLCSIILLGSIYGAMCALRLPTYVLSDRHEY
jgi:hypothetical protein